MEDLTPAREAGAPVEWQLRREPRRWQGEALERWSDAYEGIVAVVTGAGKTFFAMQCVLRVSHSHPQCRFLVVVPTVALLDQWRAALTEELEDLLSKKVHCRGDGRMGKFGVKVFPDSDLRARVETHRARCGATDS